jgi:L-threonylcarbamoyladenylate synthase
MTKVLKADAAAIGEAADLIRRGGLVAFPTETVYGLGANVLDAAAVHRIFEAKGRPATNPIIVHIGSVNQLAVLTNLPPVVELRLNKLTERFWPGPLTLVLPKAAAVPEIVTAGGPTVGVRAPAHPVALALLRDAGVPLAAPSANRSTELSPTTAEHVLRSLDGRIDLILDGGPTSGGIESTVLDLTTEPPRVLRPGLVTPGEIEAVMGPIRWPQAPVAHAPSLPLPSPGMMQKHYAPRAPLELVDGDGRSRAAVLTSGGQRVGWLTWPGTPEVVGPVRIDMPVEPARYAAKLFAVLHDLEMAGVARIVVARPPDGEDWLAIRDRLRRASG